MKHVDETERCIHTLANPSSQAVNLYSLPIVSITYVQLVVPQKAIKWFFPADLTVTCIVHLLSEGRAACPALSCFLSRSWDVLKSTHLGEFYCQYMIQHQPLYLSSSPPTFSSTFSMFFICTSLLFLYLFHVFICTSLLLTCWYWRSPVPLFNDIAGTTAPYSNFSSCNIQLESVAYIQFLMLANVSTYFL